MPNIAIIARPHTHGGMKELSLRVVQECRESGIAATIGSKFSIEPNLVVLTMGTPRAAAWSTSWCFRYPKNEMPFAIFTNRDMVRHPSVRTVREILADRLKFMVLEKTPVGVSPDPLPTHPINLIRTVGDALTGTDLCVIGSAIRSIVLPRPVVLEETQPAKRTEAAQ